MFPSTNQPGPRPWQNDQTGTGQGGGAQTTGIVRGDEGGMGRNMAGLGQGGGGGLVAGGGGGFDSTYVGRGAPGSGMVNPQGGGQSFKPIPQLAGNEPIGGGLASLYPQGTGQVSMFGPTGRQGGGSTAPNTGAGNQWEGWDFAKQGGGNPAAGGAPDAGIIAQNQQRAGLAGLKQQAAGPQVMPVAPNQSVVSKANPQGLNMLVQQSKKKPLKKSPQTYRPTQVGVYT